MSDSSQSPLLVVAGIIRDAHGNVLLSKRPVKKHQGGLWEFPGGKVEPGETPAQALARELDEELGIHVTGSEPFMTIDHDYPDLSVRLMFRTVDDWHGEAHGKEQQPVKWFSQVQLTEVLFPEANKPVVTALQLPDRLCVTPARLPNDWRAEIQKATAAGVSLFYARLPEAPIEQIESFVEGCHALGAKVMLADNVALANRLQVDGLHLTIAGQQRFKAGLPDWNGLRSMACHNEAQLALAEQWQVDLVTLSPVQNTSSHPNASPMGWAAFQQLATGRPFSVYALGGMTDQDVATCRSNGGRGIAGISLFWS